MIKDKIKTLFNNSKNLNQINKLLITLIFCMLLLLGIELIFSIPEVASYFSADLLLTQSGKMIWIILWVIMFAQVTIIPIPAMPIYIVCNNINGLVAYGSGLADIFSLRTLFFCVWVTSACLVGCIAAYFIGRSGGKVVVKWIAGDQEEFEKWCKILNSKYGKLIYAATVLLPLFPDDLLSFVVGSLKIRFSFYVAVNFICKLIGAFCFILFMRLPIINNIFTLGRDGFPTSMVIYGATIILSIVLKIICKQKIKRITKKESCMDNMNDTGKIGEN